MFVCAMSSGKDTGTDINLCPGRSRAARRTEQATKVFRPVDVGNGLGLPLHISRVDGLCQNLLVLLPLKFIQQHHSEAFVEVFLDSSGDLLHPVILGRVSLSL